MKHGIRNIKARAVLDYSSADTLSDKFFVFDSYSEEIEDFNRMAVTDFPVRLDIVTAIICEEGFLKIRIGYNNYVVRKNDFINILPHKVFQVMEVSEDFKAKVICMEPGFFDFNNDQYSYNVQKLLKEYPHQSLSLPKMEFIILTFNHIKRVVQDRDNIYRKQIIYNYLSILFYEICNLLVNEKERGSTLSPNEEIFSQFMKEVETNFQKERNVGFYANKACLTPKYFSSMIFRLTGKHAKEWIDEYSILEAKAMLKSTYLTIQQISYELNFATPSHFGRYFKRHVQMSPKEYRKS